MRLAAAGALGAAGALLLAGPAPAQVDRRSTLAVRIQALGDAGFRILGTAPGERWAVREELGTGRPARERRRRSLLYFSQLTDFQLADEESPARVEFLDREGHPLKSAWRPQEALGAQTVDAAIRQVNAFADRSPVAQEAGRRARMAFALVTGDNVDNHQLNETRWEVQLLEGGSLTPNSGASDPRPVYTGGERASRLRGRARALGRLGASTWFVAPARRGARGVFRVRNGRVRDVGLADARHARTARSARRLLRGLGAG